MPRTKILYRPYFLTVDKPVGLTSHDVVGILRAVTGIPKIGHTGTLDPFATGVLPIAIGTATRLIQFLPEEKKSYRATLHLGSSTDTADNTGNVLVRKEVPQINEEVIRRILISFVGPQSQKPPAYAAIKVNGKKLYQYARQGLSVDVPERQINVFHMEYISHTENSVTFESSVSKGTYIRALGEEIATRIGTVGHLSALRRTESGPFNLQNSVDFGMVSNIVCGVEDWHAAFKAPRENRLPRVSRTIVKRQLFPYMQSAYQIFKEHRHYYLSEEEHAKVLEGRLPKNLPKCDEPILCLSYEQKLIALCSLKDDSGTKKWSFSRVISSSAVSMLYERPEAK